jgi:hypothetical protein
MKTITPAISLAIAAISLLTAPGLFARGAEDKTEQFPHVIDYELGASGFADGDQITITSVRGDREHIEPGGSYLVEGSYTLASANNAELALFCTTRGPSGPMPIQDGQRIKISKGAGKFYLYETNLPDGWLHVSFYPDNSSWHGGVYFGEKEKENTVMRKQEWFKKPDTSSSQTSDANRALIVYLGDPVPPPADMDAKYTKEGLSNAVQLAAKNAGIIPKRIAIDDSEFPFLVGVVCAGSDAAKLKAALKKMEGYAYGGGVGDDSRSDGGDTCNAFCLVPYEACPAQASQQIYHRRTLREEVFYDKLSAQK